MSTCFLKTRPFRQKYGPKWRFCIVLIISFL